MSQEPVSSRKVEIQANSEGKYRLISVATQQPVTKIPFDNRRAARNWGTSRMFDVVEALPVPALGN